MKAVKINYSLLTFMVVLATLTGCNSTGKKSNKMKSNSVDYTKGTYGYDVAFLKNYITPIELTNGNEKVLLSAEYQGRVITSSAAGNNGASYGWVNYGLISSGKKSRQFNAYGGEERLWLGPEGGPFSIFFKPGADQVFANWKVPKEVDTEPFKLVDKTTGEVSFSKQFSLTNALGTSMNISISRDIKILTKSDIENALQVGLDTTLRFVAFQSENTLTNEGPNEWNEKNGVLSLWLLCQFNPSEQGVVFIPFRKGSEAEAGKIVTDDYFGKVPPDRLIVKDGMLFFKTDGKYRSKIGIPPPRALPYCGSYDATNHVLTILWYSKPDTLAKYVNSVWNNKDPLNGDVVNAYNDGRADDGTILGPFYEMESSSPAAILKSGQKITHTNRIFHISGDETGLSRITEKLFGVSIDEIKSVF